MKVVTNRMVKIPLTDWLRGMQSDLQMKQMVWTDWLKAMQQLLLTDWWMALLKVVPLLKNRLRLYLTVVEKLKLPRRAVPQ